MSDHSYISKGLINKIYSQVSLLTDVTLPELTEKLDKSYERSKEIQEAFNKFKDGQEYIAIERKNVLDTKLLARANTKMWAAIILQSIVTLAAILTVFIKMNK